MLFGWGDGGGGPNMDHIERLERLANVDGVPKVAIRDPYEFFEDVGLDSSTRDKHDNKMKLDLPVWVGELVRPTLALSY